MGEYQSLKNMPNITVHNFVQHLHRLIDDVLGENMLGMYVYGSLVWGDFDVEISDIDIMVVTKKEITSSELHLLQKMHTHISTTYPSWDDRIEVQYVSQAALWHFRDGRKHMGNISPGEPLHMVECNIDWLVNWYLIQQYGMRLSGPESSAIIPYIAKHDFLDHIKKGVIQWNSEISKTKNNLPYQSYARLTVSRGYYTLVHGEQVSKKHAASRLVEKHPEWSLIMEEALLWRAGFGIENIDYDVKYLETKNFVAKIVEKLDNL